jgi:hypothetical protein
LLKGCGLVAQGTLKEKDGGCPGLSSSQEPERTVANTATAGDICQLVADCAQSRETAAAPHLGFRIRTSRHLLRSAEDSPCPWPESFLPPAKEKLSLSIRPVTVVLEEYWKHLLYAKAPGRRGNKVRFNMHFASILA